MRSELLYNRLLSVLLLGAVVFAPSPRGWGGTPSGERPAPELLAAQILSPTFDQGLIREGVRSSFSVVGKRRDAPAHWPELPVLSWSIVLLAAAVLVFNKGISKPYLIGTAPLGSRAPPQSV